MIASPSLLICLLLSWLLCAHVPTSRDMDALAQPTFRWLRTSPFAHSWPQLKCLMDGAHNFLHTSEVTVQNHFLLRLCILIASLLWNPIPLICWPCSSEQINSIGICLFVWLSVCLCVFPSVCLCVCRCLSARLSRYCLLVRLSGCVCLSVRLSSCCVLFRLSPSCQAGLKHDGTTRVQRHCRIGRFLIASYISQ